MNDYIKVIRCCQARDKNQLLNEINNAASVDVVHSTNYNGLTVGIYGENKELNHLSKEVYIKSNGSFSDLKNYIHAAEVKINSHMALSQIAKQDSCFNKTLYVSVWSFEVRAADIIDYCGYYIGNDFNCDGIVIRPGSEVKNIKLLEQNTYKFNGNMKHNCLIALNGILEDIEKLNRVYKNRLNSLINSGTSISMDIDFMILCSKINILQEEGRTLTNRLITIHEQSITSLNKKEGCEPVI